MYRRDFLKTACVTSPIVLHPAGMAAPARRPNLLVIHTDEHNFRTLGCYRATLSEDQAFVWGKGVVVDTPHVDWLARNGALCTRFYATTPVCSPSRAAFVSGRYPQNTPVTTNNIPLQDGIVTFAEILAKVGYATGYAGKWHLDGGGKPQWEPEREFGFRDNRYMFNRGHWKILEDTPDGPRVGARSGSKPTYGVAGATAKSFTTDFLADKTIEFIQANRDKPFCYMVSIPDPHGPNTVRAPYDTMFDHLTFEVPRTMGKPADNLPSWGKKQANKMNDSAMAKYFGMVKCIDDNVGRILDVLRKDGLIENTIVVFTADHGDLCGEHGRHNKGVPYETSARVPFVVYAPGAIKPGTIVNQALSCVDFLPTILGLMGVQTAGKEEGRDTSALFAGKAPDNWDDIAFFRSTSGAEPTDGWLAAVTSRHKIVFSSRDEPWLFDLETEPDEVTNFLRNPAYRETVRSMSKALIAYCKKHRDPYGELPRIKADLAWGAGDKSEYSAPSVPAPVESKPAGRRRTRQGD